MWLRIESAIFPILRFCCLAVICHLSTYSWQHMHTGLVIWHHAHAANLCMWQLTSSSALFHSWLTVSPPAPPALFLLTFTLISQCRLRLWLVAFSPSPCWCEQMFVCPVMIRGLCSHPHHSQIQIFWIRQKTSWCICWTRLQFILSQENCISVCYWPVIKSSKLHSLNRCLSNYIYRLYYNINFLYDRLYT